MVVRLRLRPLLALCCLLVATLTPLTAPTSSAIVMTTAPGSPGRTSGADQRPHSAGIGVALTPTTVTAAAPATTPTPSMISPTAPSPSTITTGTLTATVAPTATLTPAAQAPDSGAATAVPPVSSTVMPIATGTITVTSSHAPVSSTAVLPIILRSTTNVGPILPPVLPTPDSASSVRMSGSQRGRPLSAMSASATGNVLPTGIITTYAGGFIGDGGLASQALLDNPSAVAVDSQGNLIIADFNHNRIRKVTVSTGAITTIAGTGTPGYYNDGGPATQAQIDAPSDLALDGAGDIFFTEPKSSRVREVIASSGVLTTVVQNPALPTGIGVDGAGDLFIAYPNTIAERIAATGVLTTVAGDGSGCAQQVDSLLRRRRLPRGAGNTQHGYRCRRRRRGRSVHRRSGR